MDHDNFVEKNKENLRNQIIDFFPSYYMTLISVIQATTLGYLLLILSNVLTRKTFNISHSLPLFLSFLVIIEIWYEYVMGSASLRWVPHMLDSTIPFLLGLTQFLMIFSVKSGRCDW